MYGWNLFRKVLSRGANFLATTLLNPQVSDLTSRLVFFLCVCVCVCVNFLYLFFLLVGFVLGGCGVYYLVSVAGLQSLVHDGMCLKFVCEERRGNQKDFKKKKKSEKTIKSVWGGQVLFFFPPDARRAQ